MQQAGVLRVAVSLDHIHLPMNPIILSPLLSIGPLHLLLQLVLGVEDGVLRLHDVHFGHCAGRILLGGDDAHLVAVVFEF